MGVPLYNYGRWANFSKSELVCQHTGLENPNIRQFEYLMDFIQEMRTELGVPFIVTSAYRHPTHPSEACKDEPGQHTIAAIDIQVPTAIAWRIGDNAFARGAGGIGLKMHGPHKDRFIHIDFRDGPRRIWSYP